MILPGRTNAFQGVVGGTFDTIITLYQGVPTSIWGGIWQPQPTYQLNTITIGSNSVAYIALSVNSDINPTTDGGAHWLALTPLNLTGWTGLFQINPPTSTPQASAVPVLGGSAGTVAVNVSATALASFAAGLYPCFLQLTDGSGDVYYPIIGQINLVNPI